MKIKMCCLTIRIKRNEEYQGKRLQNILINFLMDAKIAGATVWNKYKFERKSDCIIPN
jgi:PII-like signaling protein